MTKRGLTIVTVATLAILGLLSVRVAADNGTPIASPAASPAGSPGASPGASPAGAGDVAAGKALTQAFCISCHTTDGRRLVGPSWKGLYGSTVELEGGQTVVADDAYLVESIKNPNAKIVKGYPPAMPPFGTILTDKQIRDIVAYLKTLK